MRLVQGKGSPTKGACWMSAVNWYVGHGREGFKWSDHPDCVDPVIRDLCIRLNDRLKTDAERERVIGPHIFAPVGTNLGRELSIRRAFMCADRAVRVWAPGALERSGHKAQADALRSLPEIVDIETARKARADAAAAYAADAAAYADAAAAYSAALAASADAYAAAAAADSEILDLILELCAMGRCEPDAAHTQQETLDYLCSFERTNG